MSESVIRIEARRDFTVLQNKMLRDRRLSLKIKGLFAVMLSRPGNWQFSVSGLSAFTGAGRDAIRSALKELRETGYLTLKQQSHEENGKFSGSVYILHEEGIHPLEEAKEEQTPWPDNPYTDNPPSAQPSTENPTQINTDLTKDCLNKPPKAPQGGRRDKYKLTEEAKGVLQDYVAGDRELAEAMGAFMEMRTAKRAVNSARGIRLLLAELERLSGGDRGTKLALLRQSTVNSWKGIFPLRGSPPSGGRVMPSEEVPTW